jgi:hypothetical protein
MNLDPEAVRNLRESFEKVGQVYSIIVCMQHPGFVIAGRHRKAAGAGLVHQLDVEAKCRQLGVSHDLAHLLLRQHLNVQRVVSEDERREEVLAMAKALEAQGVEKSKVAARLAQISTFSDRYLRELLPDEYKQVGHRPAGGTGTGSGSIKGPEGKKGQEPRESEPGAKDEAERHAPFAKGIAPSPREGLKPQYTEEHMKLASAFNAVGLFPDIEKPFAREGEFTKEGKPKQYFADLHFGEQKVVVEVEGEGSASAGNDERDVYFAEQGYQLVHVPNACARSYGHVLAALVRAFTRET